MDDAARIQVAGLRPLRAPLVLAGIAAAVAVMGLGLGLPMLAAYGEQLSITRQGTNGPMAGWLIAGGLPSATALGCGIATGAWATANRLRARVAALGILAVIAAPTLAALVVALVGGWMSSWLELPWEPHVEFSEPPLAFATAVGVCGAVGVIVGAALAGAGIGLAFLGRAFRSSRA